MNKKHRLVFGVAVVAVLLGYLAFISVDSNRYEVSEAVAAKEKLADKIILVNGTMVAGTDQKDVLNRTMTFKLTDGISTIDVVYTGVLPDIPPGYTNIGVVATGQFDNNVFKAFKILTKCPSKYVPSSDNITK